MEFYGADFGGGANFFGASFGGKTNLLNVSFGDEVSFSNATFSDKVVIAGSRDRFAFQDAAMNAIQVDFRDVHFEKPDDVVFRDTDLRRAYLLNIDVRKFDFTSIRWPQIEGGNCVYDEITATEKFREKATPVPHGALAQLYRRLKQNYENQRNHGPAGDFHFREKEMRRLNSFTPKTTRFLLALYRILSGYGERLWASGWLVGLVITSAILSILAGLEVNMSATKTRLLGWTSSDFGWGVVYSLQAALFRKPAFASTVNAWGAFVQTLTMVLGPLFLALFALAVRRRLRR